MGPQGPKGPLQQLAALLFAFAVAFVVVVAILLALQGYMDFS
jgi:hypothetical protein